MVSNEQQTLAFRLRGGFNQLDEFGFKIILIDHHRFKIVSTLKAIQFNAYFDIIIQLMEGFIYGWK